MGVFVSHAGEVDSAALIRFIMEHRSLPERVLLVRWHTADVPHVPAERQVCLTDWRDGISVADITFGFNDESDLPRAIERDGVGRTDGPLPTYYVSPDPIHHLARGRMPPWRRALFQWMARGEEPAVRAFRLPPERTFILE